MGGGLRAGRCSSSRGGSSAGCKTVTVWNVGAILSFIFVLSALCTRVALERIYRY